MAAKTESKKRSMTMKKKGKKGKDKASAKTGKKKAGKGKKKAGPSKNGSGKVDKQLLRKFKEMQETYQETDAAPDYSGLPVGTYHGNLQELSLQVSKGTDRLQVMYHLVASSPDKFEGRHHYAYKGIETDVGISIWKREMKVIGCELPSKLGAKCQKAMDEALGEDGVDVEFRVQEKDEYMNTYITRILEDDEEALEELEDDDYDDDDEDDTEDDEDEEDDEDDDDDDDDESDSDEDDDDDDEDEDDEDDDDEDDEDDDSGEDDDSSEDRDFPELDEIEAMKPKALNKLALKKLKFDEDEWAPMRGSTKKRVLKTIVSLYEGDTFEQQTADLKRVCKLWGLKVKKGEKPLTVILNYINAKD
jgi:hypothetical protein